MAVAHYNCDYCNNMVYDEETEQFVCDVDMDEDDYARLLTSEYKECPYYQSNDEYKIVRHQMNQGGMRQVNARIIVIHSFVFGLSIFLSLIVKSNGWNV